MDYFLSLPRGLLWVLALPLVAGCGDTGGLAGAGATPTASGPVHLWPERKGAAVPPADPGGAPPEYVKGLPRVRDQNVHEVDPVALVQAEVAASGRPGVGPDGMHPQTVAAIKACGKAPAGAPTEAPTQTPTRRPTGAPPQTPAPAPAPTCPVLTPYYRDLTGNGRDELIVGIEMPEHMMSVRVYTADPDGRLNRIMATTQTVVGVELAGRDVVLRVPSGNPGYELITAWSWDEKQRTMLPAREQIVRVPAGPQGAGR